MISEQCRNTVRDAYESVFESERYSLTDLVNPSDIVEGADSWDEITEQEIDSELRPFEGRDVLSEYGKEFSTLSIAADIVSMPRVGMSKLVYDNKRKALKNGIHPNSMSFNEAFEALYDIDRDIYGSDYAGEIIRGAVYDRVHPKRDKWDSFRTP